MDPSGLKLAKISMVRVLVIIQADLYHSRQME